MDLQQAEAGSILASFLIAAVIGLVGYLIATIVPFLKVYAHTIGIILFLIVFLFSFL